MEYLKKWEMFYAEDLAKALNNKKVQDNLRDGPPFPYTTKDGEEYINFILNAEKDSIYGFAIVYEGEAIGSIAVIRNENIHYRTGELGYYISEDFWGKGIGTKAVKEICKYVFENTNIVRIFAEPYSRNYASNRLLEKSGFDLVGVLHKNAEKNGEILDMNLFEIINPRFRD